MFNYLAGLVTSSIIFSATIIFMGFQYGGTQHFSDIIANSITLVDKNGLGANLKVLNDDGKNILSINDGKIKIFNEEGVEVITMMSDSQGRGHVRLKNGGYLDTFNDGDNKTAIIGENSYGDGMLSTFNSSAKQTSLISSIKGGFGKLTIFDNQGRESLHLLKSLTTFNAEGRITGKYGTNNTEDGSVMLYDRFGNRGWYKSGKSS